MKIRTVLRSTISRYPCVIAVIAIITVLVLTVTLLSRYRLNREHNTIIGKLEQLYASSEAAIQIRRYYEGLESWGNPRGDRLLEGLSASSSYAKDKKLVLFIIATASSPHRALAYIEIPADLVDKDPLIKDIWDLAASDGKIAFINLKLDEQMRDR